MRVDAQKHEYLCNSQSRLSKKTVKSQIIKAGGYKKTSKRIKKNQINVDLTLSINIKIQIIILPENNENLDKFFSLNDYSPPFGDEPS